ncbi:hypothetical protein TFGB2_01189 [Neisseria gonorrhoeae]|nr:hypothetical protein TFGB2_01189 [Neisseria gonorrhoeae]
MKTRNIAFKFAVLAAVLAAAMPSDSPRRRKPYGKGKTRRYCGNAHGVGSKAGAGCGIERRDLAGRAASECGEEAGCRRVHGDAEVPEGKE